MFNLGSSIIVKLVKHLEKYHVFGQSHNGVIFHHTFYGEEEARNWIRTHVDFNVKLEEV